jgi:membrane-associated phospholipid phosphatase
MSSELAEPSATAGSRGAATRLAGYRAVAGRWLIFSDYGPVAQRHMALAWSSVLACALADAIWLPLSGLSFASSNWITLLKGVLYCAVACVLIAIAFGRLQGDAGRASVVLRAALTTTELLCATALVIGALLTAGVTLSYIIAAAGLPLQDSLLAEADRGLGFEWPRFLQATNSSPWLATVLTRAYQATGLVTEFVILWLAVTRNGERLAEFLAVLGLCTVGLCVGMWLVPAAGAFAYYGPGPGLFANYSALGEMWTFHHTFNMLRSGSLSLVDLSALDGVVSFPSFHTMLGVMTTYAMRDSRWLIAVFPLNATMIVATMPVGGHHLVDVLAGAGLTLGAILLVRLSASSRGPAASARSAAWH